MNEKLAVEFAIAVKSMLDNAPAFLAKVRFDAKLHREKYLSLIEAGFNESQALELCKNI